MTEMHLSPWSDAPLAPATKSSLRDLWALSKQIDGLGGEWGFGVFVYRALNFHFSPPRLYEPLRNFDDAWLSVWMRQKAASMGVDPEGVGGTSVSFRYWASTVNSEDGFVPMPAEGERYLGVHSVQLIGAPARDQLMFANSWSGWAKGDNIGILSREYLDAYATSYFADRPWNVGPLGETTTRLFKTDSSLEFVELWNRARPRLQVRLKSDLKLEIYEGWSYGFARPAYFYVMILGPRTSPVKVASCLVHDHYGKHNRATRPFISEIIDLFIWPPYRQRHYGRLLERIVSERARIRGTDMMKFPVWQADCVKPDSRDRAISFLRDQKYEIESIDGAQRSLEGMRDLR